jgi:hypothetical protein
MDVFLDRTVWEFTIPAFARRDGEVKTVVERRSTMRRPISRSPAYIVCDGAWGENTKYMRSLAGTAAPRWNLTVLDRISVHGAEPD